MGCPSLVNRCQSTSCFSQSCPKTGCRFGRKSVGLSSACLHSISKDSFAHTWTLAGQAGVDEGRFRMTFMLPELSQVLCTGYSRSESLRNTWLLTLLERSLDSCLLGQQLGYCQCWLPGKNLPMEDEIIVALDWTPNTNLCHSWGTFYMFMGT